jgi:hypothetical protein
MECSNKVTGDPKAARRASSRPLRRRDLLTLNVYFFLENVVHATLIYVVVRGYVVLILTAPRTQPTINSVVKA